MEQWSQRCIFLGHLWNAEKVLAAGEADKAIPWVRGDARLDPSGQSRRRASAGMHGKPSYVWYRSGAEEPGLRPVWTDFAW